MSNSGGSLGGGSGERRLVVAIRNAAVTGIGSLVLTLPLKALHVLHPVVAVRIFAFVVIFFALVYLARWEIHLEGLIHGYKGKVHLAVVVVEGLIALVFLSSGPVLLVDPDSVLQFAVAGVMAVAVLTMGLLTSWLGDRFGVKSGTDLAPHCRLLKVLRKDIFGRLDHVRFFEWLDEKLDLKAPLGHVSYPVLWTTAALITVMGANAFSVGRLVYGLLSEQPPMSRSVVAHVHQSQRRLPQPQQCPQFTVAALKSYLKREEGASYS